MLLLLQVSLGLAVYSILEVLVLAPLVNKFSFMKSLLKDIRSGFTIAVTFLSVIFLAGIAYAAIATVN